MKIRLQPISKRAKDRVNEHGDTFEFIRDGEFAEPPIKDTTNCILVESLNKTFRGEKWMGWLELDKDVKIVSENPA